MRLEVVANPHATFAVDFFVEASADRDVAVAFDRFAAVVGHGEVGVVADGGAVVVLHALLTRVLDMQLQILLGMHVDELFAGPVFEGQLVKTFTLMRLGLDRGTGFVGGQRIRRQVRCVVGASGDQRLIGVTFKKADYDFVANARNRDAAIATASPALADANLGVGRFFHGFVFSPGS